MPVQPYCLELWILRMPKKIGAIRGTFKPVSDVVYVSIYDCREQKSWSGRIRALFLQTLKSGVRSGSKQSNKKCGMPQHIPSIICFCPALCTGLWRILDWFCFLLPHWIVAFCFPLMHWAAAVSKSVWWVFMPLFWSLQTYIISFKLNTLLFPL